MNVVVNKYHREWTSSWANIITNEHHREQTSSQVNIIVSKLHHEWTLSWANCITSEHHHKYTSSWAKLVKIRSWSRNLTSIDFKSLTIDSSEIHSASTHFTQHPHHAALGLQNFPSINITPHPRSAGTLFTYLRYACRPKIVWARRGEIGASKFLQIHLFSGGSTW